MMKTLKNPFLGKGLPEQCGLADGSVSQDVAGAENLFRKCPRADETPLLIANDLAAGLDIGNLALKDERQRMGLWQLQGTWRGLCDCQTGGQPR